MPEPAPEYPWPERMPDTGRTVFAMQLSIAIRDLREARHWPPKALAERAQVSASTIRAIEKGLRGVGDDIQGRIAFAFGMRASELCALAERIPLARCQQVACERRVREAQKGAQNGAQ